MTPAAYFRSQAYNNAWANHRLLSACAELSEGELNAPRMNAIPTIIKTLNHILIVDVFYVNGLDGTGHENYAFGEDMPCPQFADLTREQRTVDRRLITFCEALDINKLTDSVSLPFRDKTQIEQVDRVLLHLFQHQIHHRGQIHAMLSGTNIAPPQLDEFFLTYDIDLRTPDFAELDFIEEKIWC